MPARSLKLARQERTVLLDARPDRLDLRDRTYSPALRSLPSEWPAGTTAARWLPQYERAGLVLDQGSEGACTGFGLAASINYLRFLQDLSEGREQHRRVSERMLYELARAYDEWPGEDYEGSSCRGALRGWHRHGVCRQALWPYSSDGVGRPVESSSDRDDPEQNWDVDALQCSLGVYYRVDARSVVDMQAAIFEVGTVYGSATVHEGWDDVGAVATLGGHADLPRIAHVSNPRAPGGHAFAIVGYNELGFVVQNSWGPRWGAHGFALLPYEDWAVHGTDAWVFTLGVPRPREIEGGGRRRTPRHLVNASSAPEPSAAGRVNARSPVTCARAYRGVPAVVQPWSTDQAYAHTILMDRGLALRSDISTPSASQSVRAAALERPLEWLSRNRSRKLLIYAHGGLDSERDSIERIRVLAPYAVQNGIYPLFLSWRTGALETASDLVEERFGRLFGRAEQPLARGAGEWFREASDRALESLLRGPGAALWEQMKLNARRATESGAGGCRLLIDALAGLERELGELEIHLLGHSAGANLLGAMLGELERHELDVSTLRLWAPACTTQFALDHYLPQVGRLFPAEHFHIHVLSDENERRDCVGPYRKSILYLISRAFEEIHKTPLLGLERIFEADALEHAQRGDLWSRESQPQLARWAQCWPGLGARLHVLRESSVHIGQGRERPASHASFDNSVDRVAEALAYVVDPVCPPKDLTIHLLDY